MPNRLLFLWDGSIGLYRQANDGWLAMATIYFIFRRICETETASKPYFVVEYIRNETQ